jgi:hypothetical protein
VNTSVLEEVAASIFTPKKETACSNKHWYLATELLDVTTQITVILL